MKMKVIVSPAGNKEPLKVWLPPVTVEENAPNKDKKSKPYRIAVMIGMTTAIKLAVKPNRLPDSKDILTHSLTLFNGELWISFMER
jgi:hypothetical protein